jgi:hypothetical protein
MRPKEAVKKRNLFRFHSLGCFEPESKGIWGAVAAGVAAFWRKFLQNEGAAL